jgi:hypothetical protein
MGQEGYLQGVDLRLVLWSSDREGWDHDHCAFCSAKIWDRASGADEYDCGYTTNDKYHWVCEGCFADFEDRFGWEVLPS